MKRPKLRIIESRPGLYELWFGKWLLTGSTNREYLEHLMALMTP